MKIWRPQALTTGAGSADDGLPLLAGAERQAALLDGALRFLGVQPALVAGADEYVVAAKAPRAVHLVRLSYVAWTSTSSTALFFV